MGEEFVRLRCPTCSALARVPRVDGLHPCPDCGASITVRVTERRPPPLPVAEPDPLADIESEDESREFIDRLGTLSALRWLYLPAILMDLVVLAVGMQGLKDPDQPLLRSGLMLAFLSSLVVVKIFALFLWLHQPVLWSMIAAVLGVVLSAGGLVGILQEGFTGAAIAGSAVLVLWAGAQVVLAVVGWRLRRISREQPDAYAAFASSGSMRSRKPAKLSAQEWSEKLLSMRADKRRFALWRAFFASAFFLAITAMMSFAMGVRLRPQHLDDSVASFLQAWENEDAQAIASMAVPTEREDIQRRLSNIARVQHWTAGWPPLLESERTVGDASTLVGFSLVTLPTPISADEPDAGEEPEEPRLVVEWVLSDLQWRLKSIAPPLPNLDEARANFDKAWASSKPSAIAALFSADSREKMERAMERRIAARNWQDGFPPLEFQGANQISPQRAEANFLCEGKPLAIRWKLDPDDNWVLSGIDWPKSE